MQQMCFKNYFAVQSFLIPKIKFIRTDSFIVFLANWIGSLNKYNMKEQQKQLVDDPLSNNKRRHYYALKAAVVVPVILGFLINRFLSQQSNVACLKDVLHDVTLTFNQFLVDARPSSAGGRNQLSNFGVVFMSAQTLIMNAWFLILGIIWVLKVKNMRCFGSLTAFFLVRNIIFIVNTEICRVYRNFHILKYDLVGPWFLFLRIHLRTHSRLLLLGHTGTLTIIFLEMVVLGLRFPSAFAFSSIIFMVNMLLITRAHYVTDIFGGLLFAFWFHRNMPKVVIYIDKTLSFPFIVGKWIYEKKLKAQDAQRHEESECQPQECIQPKLQLNNSLDIQLKSQLIETKSINLDNRQNPQCP